MILGYVFKLDLIVRFTNVGVMKIDDFTLKIFRIVLASFQREDKFEKVRFF